MKSYIKCVGVDYESSRIEEFNGKCMAIVKINASLALQIYSSTSRA